MNTIELLSESDLSLRDFTVSTNKERYLANLIDAINSKTPLPVAKGYADKSGHSTVVLDPSSISVIKKIISTRDPKLLLKTIEGAPIRLSSIEKSSIITGRVKPNLGYVGEISLGVAIAARFLNLGKPISYKEFIRLTTKLQQKTFKSAKTGKEGNSRELFYEGKLKHQTGKVDNFLLRIVAPGIHVKLFVNYLENPGSVDMETDKEIKQVILSAVEYANTEPKIDAGINKTSKDPNTNSITVIGDGVSDNRGTKADLVMEIDGSRINLLSVKTAESQLGQASGHVWQKQEDFFKLVFGLNVKPYKKLWGTTNKEHLATLQQIWTDAALPAVTRLTGANVTAKEKKLITSIVNGLIRYSNDIDVETGEVKPIDIVKLAAEPGSPGYKMMKIDSELTKALDKTDLVAVPVKNGQGVNIYGRVQVTDSKGRQKLKDVLFCKFWSSYSTSGDVVRTAVAGGPLLDQLALVTKPQPVTPAPVVKPPVAKTPVAKTPAPKVRAGAAVPKVQPQAQPDIEEPEVVAQPAPRARRSTTPAPVRQRRV